MAEITMTKKKDTKGTVVYECKDEGALIDTVYINKPGALELGDTITITVEGTTKPKTSKKNK